MPATPRFLFFLVVAVINRLVNLCCLACFYYQFIPYVGESDGFPRLDVVCGVV